MAKELTYNERILDAEIAHQIGILRFQAGLSDRVIAQLVAVEKDLRKQLADRLSKISERGYDLGPANTKRLRFLNAAVREILSKAYENVGETLKSELFGLANHEVDFQTRLLQANTPLVDLSLAIPPAAALKSIVTTDPIRGKVFGELISGASKAAITRANEGIRIGIIEGETIPQITTRVMGVEGLEIGKRGVTTLVRTAVTHTTVRARELLYSENTDVIAGVRWVSTLDGRTTPICMRLDGQIFDVGTGPRPPAHLSCRSTTAPFLVGQKEIFGDRASKFGPVPGKLTYNDWLGQQSNSFQDDVLGPARAKLFRDGGLSLDKFVDFNGHKYTLDELRKREARAFKKAGL